MTNRRTFLKASAAPLAATAFPAIIPAAALGRNGVMAPSERVTIATIGVNWMGTSHLNAFTKLPAAQLVAVCDVEETHLAKAKERVDKAYQNNDCVTYRAFEEVLARRDIDAVSIAVPDHWHGLIATLAARAGKDIYGEKPLARTFREGVAIREAVQKHKRIWQTGSWQRSTENFRQACELVRNGRIGKIKRIEVGLPGGHSDFDKTKEQTQITEPPPTLNWDRWLGPAPEAPYCVARVHKSWRWNLDYGGGQLMDWVGHHVDIAHWGMDWDNTGPLEISGKGEFPPRTALWNSATKFRIDAKYPGDVQMIIAGDYKEVRSGTKWIGETGWIWVNRGGLEASDPKLLQSVIQPNEIHLPKVTSHYGEFIDAVKSRGKTRTPAEAALRSATPGWLGQIAMQTGKKLKWDPVQEHIIGNPEAEKMLGPQMRAPWQI
ncbi:MAG: Gfo/Idh/MocA family protein [Blastocatellia bacterium]